MQVCNYILYLNSPYSWYLSIKNLHPEIIRPRFFMEFLSWPLILLFTLISSNLCLIYMQEPPTTPPPSSTTPPPPPPSSTTPPPPTPSPTPIIAPPQNVSVPSDFQEKQFLNIIDALIGAGDFAGYANFLSSASPLMLPLKATLFVPSNDALSVFPDATAAGVSIDPSILAYHITPQHLSFSDLKKLPVYSRIPTLLTSNFIIITNASSRFSIDDAEVTHPDLYISPAFSVHGVSKILDYKAYGGINITFTEEDVDDSEMGEVDNKKPNDGNYTPFFSGSGNYSSGVEVSSASDIAMIFLVLGIFLFSKID